MKYFENEACGASDHENYIEFQLPTATEEFWDKTSYYMHKEIMAESGFGEFWSNCMYNNIVFDMSSISKDELEQMTLATVKYGWAVFEIVTELSEWLENNQAEIIGVNWASDRTLAQHRAQRETYPVVPDFYEEVNAIYEQYKDLPLFEQAAVTERAYEDLLRKYKMPCCFFPFPLYEPDKGA